MNEANTKPEDRRAGLMELVEELRQRATECRAVIGVPCQSEYAWHADEYASWAHRIEVAAGLNDESAAALSVPQPPQDGCEDCHRVGMLFSDGSRMFPLARCLQHEAEALSVPSPVSGWQPIETLPDDYEWQFLTLWTDGKADMMGGMFEYRDILGYGESPATHWMPLPEAPKGPSRV